jgi:hypothetical protein
VHKLLIIVHAVQVPVHVEECLSVGILRHVVHWILRLSLQCIEHVIIGLELKKHT